MFYFALMAPSAADTCVCEVRDVSTSDSASDMGGTESDRGALLSFLTALMALWIVDIRVCEV